MKKTIFHTFLIASLLVLFSCDTKRAVEDSSVNDDVFIKNELIVQLKKGVAPRELVAAHKKYQLEMKKAVSKITNLWLFTYDTALIQPDEMLEMIKASELTDNAEYNKKLTGRRN